MGLQICAYLATGKRARGGGIDHGLCSSGGRGGRRRRRRRGGRGGENLGLATGRRLGWERILSPSVYGVKRPQYGRLFNTLGSKWTRTLTCLWTAQIVARPSVLCSMRNTCPGPTANAEMILPKSGLSGNSAHQMTLGVQAVCADPRLHPSVRLLHLRSHNRPFSLRPAIL